MCCYISKFMIHLCEQCQLENVFFRKKTVEAAFCKTGLYILTIVNNKKNKKPKQKT